MPLAQTSMRFLHIAYHDFEGIADDIGERERLVADLGDHEAMVLRNHGLLVVGRTIPATFNLLYRMERACEVQVMALSCNTKLVYPPQDVLEKTFDKVKPRAESAQSQRRTGLAGAAAEARPRRLVVSELTLELVTRRRHVRYYGRPDRGVPGFTRGICPSDYIAAPGRGGVMRAEDAAAGILVPGARGHQFKSRVFSKAPSRMNAISQRVSNIPASEVKPSTRTLKASEAS